MVESRLDVVELRRGSAAATEDFRRLVRAHVQRYFSRESQVHDVTQDALLELLAKLEAGAEPREALHWALNAAHNAVRREFTRLRHRAVEFESQVHGRIEADHAARLDAREDLRRIDNLLDETPERPKRALTGSLEGRDHNEIAAELGVSPGAARMTVARARAELSERLSAQQKLARLVQLARHAGLVEGR